MCIVVSLFIRFQYLVLFVFLFACVVVNLNYNTLISAFNFICFTQFCAQCLFFALFLASLVRFRYIFLFELFIFFCCLLTVLFSVYFSQKIAIAIFSKFYRTRLALFHLSEIRIIEKKFRLFAALSCWCFYNALIALRLAQ